jgi:GT2 family glycosyltransferase
MNNFNQISIVLITYKSEKKINKFIKKIPKKIKTIIVENSNNYKLKKNIEKKYKNIKVYIKKNEGVSASLNFATKKIKTKYFLQISPDIIFNYNDIDKFINVAKELNNKFSAIGPRFLNVNNKSHKQIKPNLNIGSINSIHGSCMFINKKNYNKIGGFDENFFLYFEETDYCKRGKNKHLKSYQINTIKVRQEGRTIDIHGKNEKQKISNLLSWHFIWSEFYFHKKYKGYLISLLFFSPLLVRTLIKCCINNLLNDEKKLKKYTYRLKGLLSSIKGERSYLRP